ncbi:DUF5994 family protein [Rhodococcus rhodochrous]|uniref:Uncharacterized protein n=1 Tax=Rhodococcus rhodochrous KG-21 TaxID=1441923 RepID=A0A0N0S0E7_RHORH|nr:DUF5994 family protein [Rhodococcus rhodochrous]KOS53901.1 hypothetical protein Z051_23050 [Rhodococcus rhodochrous KG-21]
MTRTRLQPFPQPTRTPRLLLRPAGAPESSVDGAWFPWTSNVTVELHDLVAALTPRLGAVARISFEWNALSSAQRRIDEFDGIAVTGPLPDQPSKMMYVYGENGARMVLAIIAPHTNPDRAYEIMRFVADGRGDYRRGAR